MSYLFRCASCGKFISGKDVADPSKVRVFFWPETHHEAEELYHVHVECLSPAEKGATKNDSLT